VLNPPASAAVELAVGQIQIELRGETAVQEPQVRLGDVAILHTRNLPAIERLAALPLGRAPRLGGEAVVRRDAIAKWVRSRLGVARSQVLWSGPEEIHVRSLAQEVPATRLEQIAETALREWLAQRVSRYSVHALALPGDLKLPAGQVQVKARPIAGNAEPAERMVVWLDLQVGGRFVRALPVTFTVDAYRKAWVAPERVARGVALTPAIVERREIKITGRATGAPLPLDGSRPGEILAGWRTTKALAEGEAITAHNAGVAPLIARGEWVLVHLKSGAVEVERRAQAMQDGDLGQIVQVRSPRGPASLAARVMAPGRVEATL
jgi:flagella basal body P-ring formation protein FlgA